MIYEFNIVATTNKDLPVHVFKPENSKPKALVQLLYNTNENASDYQNLIDSLVKQNFAVICGDLLEHGNNTGYAPFLENIFTLTCDQQISLNKLLYKSGNGLPIIIMGNSYGGYLTMGMMKEKSFSANAIVLANVGNMKCTKTMLQNVKFNNMALKCRKINQLNMKAKKESLYYLGKHSLLNLPNEKIAPTYRGVSYHLISDYFHNLVDDDFYDFKNYSKSKNEIPVLLVAGENDKLHTNGNKTIQLKNQLVNNNVNCDCVLVKNAGHDLLKQNNINTKEPDIMPILNNFLDKHINMTKNLVK